MSTLASFNIPAQVIGTVSGPRVTRYELQLAPGIKVSKVANLKDDLAYALAATDVRVQAPIPGKQAVGVEVPNIQANYVSLGDIHGLFPPHASPMAFWLGKDVTGKAILADLVRMVHLLIAGTTGSGKSACLNALITSILLRATPDQVRMIMIDPKKVELSNFNGVPHLLAPVVTNMKQATYVLDNICREMDRRYDVLSRNGCQDIRALNKKLVRAGEDAMPYTMVIIDELADLMMVAPSEVEDSIIRLGQLGRSCGIHLVVATQRPSVDVVTGMIKTNIPSRIAFAVSSQTDSRIILDQGGAESLLGMGDMLFSPMGSSKLLRVQGALVTSAEMKLITEHWRAAVQAGLPRGAPREPGRPGRRAVAAGGRRRRAPRRGHQDRGEHRRRQRGAAAAPPARRLRPRRSPHRHHGGDGHHLRLRRQQGALGAHRRGGTADGARPPERRRDRAGASAGRAGRGSRSAGGAACGGRAGARGLLGPARRRRLVCLRPTRLLDCTFG